ncbi:phosphotransferase [Amycolatopsis rubida]|uniref:Phosphotransferase n=1 Tax=Amycolatopsis rubida TaxID=112413 RepID=A0ABX0BNA9_9PSEU|nr:phosphotransferase [Amycolatopsis sp. M39]MYW90895.1 phosphotransferase [Amycolatopsis rubida]NEC55880.1 phosphotransferase [Amycolatopsis rubida]OAP26039.1 Homoserine kinase [Amycolatopsis sp. M39]
MKPGFGELVTASGLDAVIEPLDEASVLGALGELHGLSGRLERIASEKDETFVLHAADARYLVKVSGEAREDLALQTAVLRHLERAAPELPVPVVKSGVDGVDLHEVASGRSLRVLSFLPGEPLAERAAAPEPFGRWHGQLTRALAGFRGGNRTLLWDLRYLSALDTANGLAQEVLAEFASRVRPGELETQLVHNDMSPHNILVGASGELAGILDFGDVLSTAVVFDLAIALSNLLDADAPDLWAAPLGWLRGYLQVRPIVEEELALLPLLAVARLVQRALISSWRARRDPARAEYVRSHASRDWVTARAGYAGLGAAAERVLEVRR